MKYPIGTLFKPPKGFNWTGEVIGHERNRYQMHWTDGHGNNRDYTEEQMTEMISIMCLTWALPYTIGIDEDLFEI